MAYHVAYHVAYRDGSSLLAHEGWVGCGMFGSTWGLSWGAQAGMTVGFERQAAGGATCSHRTAAVHRMACTGALGLGVIETHSESMHYFEH